MWVLTFRKGINMKIAILEDNIFFQQKIINLVLRQEKGLIK